MTILCDLAYQYKTDKCPQIKHHYTGHYDAMFHARRDKVRKVVEIGIGCMPPHYVNGASLLMWRDYFPNATIYGADIDPQTLFTDDRIQTFLCNQSKREDLEALIKATGGDIDLFIDDGSHQPDDQVSTCMTVMSLLKGDAIYVIEDVRHREIVTRLGDFNIRILSGPNRRAMDDFMVVVRHGEW